MACRDEGQAAAQAQIDRDEAQQKIDKLTRMLCHMMTWIDRVPAPIRSSSLFSSPVGDELRQWWARHLLADEERRAADVREKHAAEGRRRDRIAELKAELARLEEQR